MKKISFFTFVAVFALGSFFSSCQQEIEGSIDNIDSTSSGSSFRVKTYTETLSSPDISTVTLTYNLTYDASNRLIKMQDVANAGNRFEYSYTGSTQFTTKLYDASVLSLSAQYFHTPSLLLDSSFQYNNEGDSSTEKYTYNASNQLTEVRFYDYSQAGGAILNNTTTVTYNANGGIQKEETITAGGTISSTTYEYGTDLVVPPSIVPSLLPIEKIYLPIKKTVVNDGETTIVTISYTFDSLGRVVKETSVTDDATSTLTFTYF